MTYNEQHTFPEIPCKFMDYGFVIITKTAKKFDVYKTGLKNNYCIFGKALIKRNHQMNRDNNHIKA